MLVNQVRNLLIVIALSFSLGVAAQDTLKVVYVSVQGSNIISEYSESSDGSLTKVYDQSVNGGPASIAISPNKKFLYVSRRTDKAFSSYSIDQTTGKLTFIGSVAALDNPVNISTDKTGRFLLSAYYAASKAAVYQIDTLTGIISSTPITSFSTAGINPHAIKTDPSNKYVFLTNMTGNGIQQFLFDATNGTLTANTPALITPSETIGPRHFVFHGSKNLVYFSNELGNKVTIYSMDASTGLLTFQQELSTLPDGYSGTNKAADIHITPDNKFLYVSNRGQDALAGFSVDATTGLLTAVGYYATQTSPRAFDIDASGSYLYAAGETSGKMSYYKINKSTGELNYLGEYTEGSNPSWVRCLSIIKSSTVSSSCDGMVGISINNLDNSGIYTMILYDAAGTTQIKLLGKGTFLAGNTNFFFSSSDLSSGTYIFKLFSGDTVVKSGIVVI